MTASPTDDHASAERRLRELTRELSEARGELAEAREQQAATAGILKVISSSPTDLQPVFAEIATSAARLLDTPRSNCQFTLNMTEYAIESVVETVRAATESLAQNKKLTLTTSVDKSLPIGLGGEQRLTQVLLNLVGNAIKFTDAGEVSIAAGAQNGNFSVSVTDTGPGIPLDQQGRIFEQFHQVDSSTTKAKGGAGLGLAIAKQIIEMHGSRIWVESMPDEGSTFQMELPACAELRRSAT
jgi:signal transduction histidine kinase